MKVLAPDHYPWLALDTNHLAGKPPLSTLQAPQVVMLVGLSKPYRQNIRAVALILESDDPGWYLVDTTVETQIRHRLKAFGRFQRDVIPARHAYLDRVPQLKDPGVLPITAAWAWWSPNRYANTPLWLSYPQVTIVDCQRPSRLTVKLNGPGITLTLTQMPVIADLEQWRLLEGICARCKPSWHRWRKPRRAASRKLKALQHIFQKAHRTYTTCRARR